MAGVRLNGFIAVSAKDAEISVGFTQTTNQTAQLFHQPIQAVEMACSHTSAFATM